MKKNRKDEVMQPGPDLLMNIDVARKIGMAYFHAGKSRNDLLGYFGNDAKSANFRQAFGVFEQLRKRYDDDRSSEDKSRPRFDDRSSEDKSRPRFDDRSSEEHAEEANRLEALAAKEKDPKMKAKLENMAEFHREEIGLDSVANTLRMDSNLRTYAFEKLTSNLAELKSRADKVFRAADKDDDDDCDEEEAETDDKTGTDAGTGRAVR